LRYQPSPWNSQCESTIHIGFFFRPGSMYRAPISWLWSFVEDCSALFEVLYFAVLLDCCYEQWVFTRKYLSSLVFSLVICFIYLTLVLWDINPPPEIPNVKAQQQSTIKININKRFNSARKITTQKDYKIPFWVNVICLE
jgi:hypothetical protein